MAVANSSGGPLGKMISPQNLAIGAAAVGMNGKEGDIFRHVVVWSVVFLVVLCVLSALQASVLTPGGALTPGGGTGCRPSYFEFSATAVSASSSVGYSSKIWSRPVS
jgi:hypothetical protein